MATRAGATERGWRAIVPCFGVTTKRAGRRSSELKAAWMWIQNDPEASANAS